MNAFEFIGLTLIAFGLGILILLGAVYALSHFIDND